jgi:chromosome segregation ATPase
MRHITFIFIILLGFSLTSYAQEISKNEQKLLKKELKDMQKNPAKYKAFKEGLEQKKSQLIELQGQLDDLNESVSGNQNNITDKDKKIRELGDEIARLKNEKNTIDKAVKDETNLDGLVYKVQVEIDEASLYQEINEENGKKDYVFTGDVDEDGARKYTLGYFKEKQEAETFRKYLNQLKIKDAKIVAYKDGKKVE